MVNLGISPFWIPARMYYSDEVERVLDQYTNLQPGQPGDIAKFINSETRDNNTYDEFYLFPLGETNGLTGFNGTVAINNGATFSLSGASFVLADTDYIDSGLDLSSLTNYSLDDGQIATFIHDQSPNSRTVMGSEVGADGTRFEIASSTVINNSMNGTFAGKVISAIGSQLLMALTREIATSKKIIVDGVDAGTVVNTTTSIPSGNLYFGALNDDGSDVDHWTGTLSTALIGAAIGFNQAAHNTNVRQLLTDLGTI